MPKNRRIPSGSNHDFNGHDSGPETEDSKYKVKLGKSRKKLRKMKRKDAKRLKHEKKLEWIQRRKLNRNAKLSKPEDILVKSKNSVNSEKKEVIKSIYKNNSSEKRKSDLQVKFKEDDEVKDKDPDEYEVEYLEKKLLKNRKNGRKVDLLKELKSEFLRDGFDEDFLDFLSDITKIGDREKVLDNDELYEEDNTLVKHRSDAVKNDDDEDGLEEEDEQDDEDEEDDNLDEDEDNGLDQENEDDDEEEYEEQVDDDEGEEEEIVETAEEIKKKQVGLVNRLSEGNYTIILNQLSEMYSKLISKGGEGTTSEMEELIRELCDLVIKMIVNEANVVISLVATQSALVCSLANQFNSWILKIFVGKLFEILERHMKTLSKETKKENKKETSGKLVVRNVIIAITSLFYYEMVEIDVIFHLIKILTKGELTEDVLQLLLILLKYSGHRINKNNEIIGYLRELVEKYKESHSVLTNRMKYIEEELNSNKKTNNIFDQFDYLKNLINNKFNVNTNVLNLNSLLSDNADIEGNKINSFNRLNNKKIKEKDELLNKAVQIGLNKDIQKTIFICIMKAVGPENALNNIMEIKLKNTQYNEVVNIIIYCYLIEKEYNFYYIKLLLLLTSRLNMSVCKRYKRCINNSIVLYFKNFKSLNQSQPVLLSNLLYQMIINKISELRILNFVSVEVYQSDSFRAFITNLFVNIVTHVEEAEGSEQVEEYLIQQLLSIKSEKYFTQLALLWSSYIEKQCVKSISKNNSPTILFKSYQKVFTS